MKRIIWIIVIAVIVAIQIIPTGRPDVLDKNPGDFLLTVAMPDSVAIMLKVSCYDCHSNQTHYPWYSYVAPASWLVARDVKLGRESLNFSDWNDADKMQKARHLSNIVEEVSGDNMPMGIFTLMHPNARLSDTERKEIIDWANAYGESLFE